MAPVLCLLALVFAACGGAQHPEAEEASVEAEVLSEPLPIPAPSEELAAEELADENPAAEAPAVEPAMEEPSGVEPGAGPLPCSVVPDQTPARSQLERFRRWLRDQAVGRQLEVERVEPHCGDREGFLVVQLGLAGPPGGLQSLGRALPLYYPGATWTAREYERLDGEMLRLRLDVEVRVPTGSEPRPRCEWDPALDCE